MEKPRNDVCGCGGRGMPAGVIDQSLIDTGEWPAITATPEARPQSRDSGPGQSGPLLLTDRETPQPRQPT